MDNSPIPFRPVPKPFAPARRRPLPQSPEPDNLEAAFTLIEEAYARLDAVALLLLAELEARHKTAD